MRATIITPTDFAKKPPPPPKKQRGRPRNRPDLTGQKFGVWTVMAKCVDSGNRGSSACMCQCSCKAGTTKLILMASLQRGDSEGCQKCVHPRRMKANAEAKAKGANETAL